MLFWIYKPSKLWSKICGQKQVFLRGFKRILRHSAVQILRIWRKKGLTKKIRKDENSEVFLHFSVNKKWF